MPADSLFNRIDPVGAVGRIGAFGMRQYRDAVRMCGLFYDTLVAFFELDARRMASATRQIISQILFSGVEALWLVGAISLLCGVTVVIQATLNMPRFGVGDYFGKVLVVVLVRELAPFFTSIVVIGRSGSGLATYIASMKVSKEVSALKVMGIDPVHFIVMPALVGMVVSMVALCMYFDVVGILGGLIVARFTADIPFGVFVQKILEALTPVDVLVSLGKSFFFGIIIAVVSCYHGLNAENAREVPKSARKAVVGSMMGALLLNVLLSVLVYYLIPKLSSRG